MCEVPVGAGMAADPGFCAHVRLGSCAERNKVLLYQDVHFVAEERHDHSGLVLKGGKREGGKKRWGQG